MDKIAAIYIRVSTDSQAEEGYSIDAQKEQLSAYCISKGIKNYEYYIDGGWSGSNMERPELQRLINDVKDDKISHCLVYKLDRLSRSQKDMLYIIEDIFIAHGVNFISATETIDTGTPMGMLMIGILAAFAQLERENIRLRTRMGMKERVKDGWWMGGGKVPFGFDYDKEKGILVQNKDAAKVKKIYELYLSGMAGQAIANLLDLKYEALTMQILKRKINYGVIEYNGEEYQGRHEPIISKETYDLAMAEMNRRSITNVTTSTYLLTGLCYCGKCGAKMRYQKWGKNGAKIVCYSQQKTKKYLIKDENCDMPKFWDDEVEDLVLNSLLNFSEEDMKQEDGSEIETMLNLLLEQKSTLEKKIKKLYNLYAESEDDILLDTIKENKKQLESIEYKIKSEEEHNSSVKGYKDYINKMEELKEKWDVLSIQERQNIIRSLVVKIVVYEDHIDLQTVF